MRLSAFVRGGYIVAQKIAEVAPPESVLVPITCRRPTTTLKKSFSVLTRILRALPRPLNDLLRIIEHICLTQIRAPRPLENFVPDAAELAAAKNSLRDRKKILFVDDSVDSGATLAAVMDIMKEITELDAVVKVAAITTTTGRPLIEPDYSLYRYVLCRCPWSLDFKSRDDAA